MKQTTQIGATVEGAISLALQKLGHTREQVDVEVLQEGKKGFLGFGSRPAEVRVTVKAIEQLKEVNEEVTNAELVSIEPVKQTEEVLVVGNEVSGVERVHAIEDQSSHNLNEENPIEAAKAYLTTIAANMGITDLRIETVSEGKYTSFKLESEKAALLIGKRGQTLNALQQLTQLVLNKSAKSFILVKLDVEDYRERRQVALEQLAERMADKAIRSRSKVVLEPMASYERKIIHNALANRLDIETYSEGVEPNRYLVIESLK